MIVGDVLVNSEPAAAFLELSFGAGDAATTQKVSVVEMFVIRDGADRRDHPALLDTAALAARWVRGTLVSGNGLGRLKRAGREASLQSN